MRASPLPHWRGADSDRLFEVATRQAGYVTNEQAAEAGYSPPLLQFYVHKGRLERAQTPRRQRGPDPAWLWSAEQTGTFSASRSIGYPADRVSP